MSSYNLIVEKLEKVIQSGMEGYGETLARQWDNTGWIKILSFVTNVSWKSKDLVYGLMKMQMINCYFHDEDGVNVLIILQNISVINEGQIRFN